MKAWLRGSCPGLAGSFNYFGTRVYFPKGCALFAAACREGVFERDNVRWLCRFASRGGTIFDVGANIGLMAVPILSRCRESCVVSFEPSPQTLKYLKRTVAISSYAQRWKVIGKALCEMEGKLDFFEAAPAMGAYNGLVDTSRGGTSHKVIVTASTLDSEWTELGKPQISGIKIDVEGAELMVLRGASECIRSQHPPILLEWSEKNLVAHGVSSHVLLEFAYEKNYTLHAMPNLLRIASAGELALHMKATESFLLWPPTADAHDH